MEVINYNTALQIISTQLGQISFCLQLIGFCVLFDWVQKRFDILKYIQKGKYK